MKAKSNNGSETEIGIEEIEEGDRYETPSGRTWEVVDSNDKEATEFLGADSALLSEVGHPESNRWMALSELSACLDCDWEVSDE